MKIDELVSLRLHNQRLSKTDFKKPAEVISWLGAVQARDFLGSLWTVGQRMKKAIGADIEQAIADRTIVRTWPLRGTLHFVMRKMWKSQRAQTCLPVGRGSQRIFFKQVNILN